jgi:NSS family neurotransmitter:Na+ symporter
MLSVGCAVGLGNVWRFPYVAGKYGGGMFVLLYLLFLVLLGFPILTMELAIGRAGKANLVGSMANLTGGKRCWVTPVKIVFTGNLLLMMYYTVISGWLLSYAFSYINGSMMALGSGAAVAENFVNLTASPWKSAGYMGLAVIIGTILCSGGLQKSVEKSVKIMMVLLFFLILILAGYALTTSGAAEGMQFYLKPDWHAFSGNFGETVFAAMGQAFFTLSIGVGSMAIFGSYIGKERRLAGESAVIIILDTLIALLAGVIIFPICFSYGVDVGSGPSLIFVSLPNIFANMPGGRWLGALFFVFLSLAALTTVVAVFENLIAFLIDQLKFKRRMAALLTGCAVFVLALPCVLGFNLWKNFQPLGKGSDILTLEDFVMSQNLLPLGAMILVLFCATHWQSFVGEANTGKGLKFPAWLRFYCSYILPLIVMVIFIWGYIQFFG